MSATLHDILWENKAVEENGERGSSPPQQSDDREEQKQEEGEEKEYMA